MLNVECGGIKSPVSTLSRKIRTEKPTVNFPHPNRRLTTDDPRLTTDNFLKLKNKGQLSLA
ncbi:hypothetical protein G4D82_12825 [Flavobacterium sp. CYK-4]|uniref:hypothetical protein n=1 Tax=Flavobacterium lotistagni TaxID=2709660 RepID=UPI00140D79CE|nr:hypothetical protein [Flavobacterium lotistagni]NHM08109.1 hypothetical protein [Flavobacterium lotistagni]